MPQDDYEEYKTIKSVDENKLVDRKQHVHFTGLAAAESWNRL